MALVLSALLAGVLAGLRTLQLEAQAQATAGALNLQQARGVAAAMDADLGRFGRDLQAQARLIERLRLLEQPAQLQLLVDSVFAMPSYAWAGVLNRQGRVQAAREGRLIGLDASGTELWRSARRGPHFGDMHEARLLAGLLPSLPSGEPWRFVDVAVPLRDTGGQAIGVLAAHLSWPWLRERIGLYAAAAPAHGAELFLAGADARQRLPEERMGEELPLRPLLAEASQGWRVLAWPDGRRYVIAWAASEGRGPYARLGWVTVVRTPLEAVQAANAPGLRWVWGSAAVTVAGTTAMAWLLATLLLQPLARFVARVRDSDGSAPEPPPRLLPAELAHMHEVVLTLVEQLHRKEAALREALEHVRGGFDNVGRAMPGLLFTRVQRGAETRYTHLSGPVQHYLGVSREELLDDRSGRAWLRHVDPADARHIATLLPRAHAGEPLALSFRVRGGDGQWRHLQTTVVPRDGGSAEERVIDGIALDITALVEARTQAQRASEAKDRFLASMSHELRTPLNGILGFAQLLESRLERPENRRQAAQIRQAGEQLLRILNDVLDLAKIEAERLELERQPFRLEELLRGCHALLAPGAAAQGLRFALELPAQPLPEVLGDAARLRQVLVNLLSNALKFTHEGSVTLALAREPDGPDGTLRVRLEVRDTGIGMSEEQVQRLFEPFQQAEASTARRYGGTGLGLWLSRRLVQAMGGTVEIASTPGRGTTLRLRLRFEPTLAAAAAAAPPDTAAASFGGVRRLNVLVVDDIAINREVLVALVRHQGHMVQECGDGESAVERVADGDIDLVLMDVEMPGLDGLEAARRIRALPGAAGRVPLWAVTGRAFEHDIAQVRAAGMDGHLSKPVSFTALAEVLQAVERGLA
ncbi:ATP-binding protein [Azohydromonas caseinilytica]|uniref:Virulence sensor protein BvgS n=1 Tax=Azohydromonas caseinilytica TaxID=2728836 RepID=A0A848F7U9_9BURK|nr:ATP-binding protein [Azohydromonas caseinilytica]NML15644.1 response regulator [Azohydromonas caseinilytica]